LLRNLRALPRRTARRQKRGADSNQECGVAELGKGGSARHSTSLSTACWTGPPPIPRRRPPRATNRVTRSSRRSPSRGAACGFWIRAWSRRGPTDQRTGRSNEPARWHGSIEGGLDVPSPSRRMKLTSHRTPDPNVDVHPSGHTSVELDSLSLM
jgi:hypothetical protein